MTGSPGAGPIRRLALAALVALAGALGPAGSAGVAAAGGLTVVGTATYLVQPANHRVHVTVDLVATNRTTETVTTRFVYDRVSLAVLPKTTGFRAVSGATRLAVAVTVRSARSTLLSIRFAKGIASGRSTAIRLSFELPDPGGAPNRAVRVGDALVGFPVWAFGTKGTPGSSATVRFPAGYHVAVAAGRLGAPTTAADGTVSLASGVLADPYALSASVVGDRPGAFSETALSVPAAGGTAQLVVRAWRDDPAWGKRTGALLKRGVPLVAAAFGLAPAWLSPIGVEETLSRSIAGEAGVYDPAAGTIRIAYNADPAVALHEASHLWADGSLFADRWIVEGLATWAGDRAAASLKVGTAGHRLTPALRAAAIPLNAWAAPEATRTGATSTAEAYGQAASAELLGLIVDRIGPDGLRTVLAAAAADEAAYQLGAGGTPARRTDGTVTDWRGLLDLIAERTGVDATDLWRTWVVRPAEAALLDARNSARAEYAALVAAAGDWSLPAALRAELGAWRFTEAKATMAEIRPVLAARDDLAAAALTAGIDLPSGLRAAFERAGPEAAAAEARTERAILDQVVAAAAARTAATGVLAGVGLVGHDPASQLASARAAFSAGDLAAAQSGAIAAREVWAGAADVGGLRLRVSVAVVLIVLVVLLLLTGRRSRRQRIVGQRPLVPDRTGRTMAGPVPRRADQAHPIDRDAP